MKEHKGTCKRNENIVLDGIIKLILCILCLFLLYSNSILCSAKTANNTSKLPHVLFLSSYDYDWDSVPRQLNGFYGTVNDYVKVEYVFMDTKKHSYEDVKKNIYKEIQNDEAAGGQFDVVVLGDDAALDFGLEYQHQLFDGIPMVFEGINSESKARKAAQDSLITGVVESFPMEDTVKLACDLNPKATKIVAIDDASESGLGSLQQYYDCQTNFPKLTFEDINSSNLTAQELQKQISSYADDTILLFLMMTEDADGNLYTHYEAVKFICQAAKIPVYKPDELGIGQGIIGGDVISYDDMGAMAGRITLKILNGTPASNIDVETTEHHPVFDENVLKKFHIKLSDLPEDAVILNHRISFWEEYHKVLIPTGTIIFLLIVIIIILYIAIHRRKRYFAEIDEKDAMLDSLLKKIPGGIAIFKATDPIKNIYVSDGILKMGGYSGEEYDRLQQDDIIKSTVYSEDYDRILACVKDAVAKKSSMMFTYRMLSQDGKLIWVQMTAEKLREEKGVPVYCAVFTKLSNENVLYRDITNESPTGVYICDTDTYDMLYINETVQNMLGDGKNYEGMKCYEYLVHGDHPCDDCRMHAMSENEYCMREMNLPSHNNMHVTMRGKIIKWNNRKAHIEYVIDDTYKYNQQKNREKNYHIQMEFLANINSGYVGNIRINLSQNYCEVGDGNNKVVLQEVHSINKYDKLLEVVCNAIPKEQEREKYIKLFSREQLLQSYNEGKYSITLEHAIVGDDGQSHYYQTTTVLEMDSISTDVQGYVYAVNIDEQKMKQELSEKSIMQGNERRCCIDIKRNKHVTFWPDESLAPTYREDSQKTIWEYLCENCTYEEAKTAFAKCNINHVIEELDSKSEYVFYWEEISGECKKYVRVSYSYMNREEGLLAFIITDITDIHNRELVQQKKLQIALDEANAADHAKAEFLSKMSHDIRTPLNAILSLTSAEMLEGTDEEKKKEYMDQIHISGKYLLGIINDVLDMSKISSQKVTLNPEYYPYSQFESIIDTVIGERCRQKGIKFNMDLRCKPYSAIVTDRVHFNQIFVNLLSNAVKFTPKGGKIDFIIDSDNSERHPNRVRFEISDSGIGMSKEFIPKAFDSFEQELHKNQDVNNMGTGLGLAIVKQLVSLFGGSITLDSELGKGTTFIVEMDLKPAKVSESIESSQSTLDSRESDALEGSHILLFEDHPINAKITMKLLERKGCITDHAENGQVGLDMFKQSDVGYYDAILMDIRMPVMNGLEATKAIRSTKRADAVNVPIIAMTANAHASDAKEAIDSGMNAHLGKPVEPNKMYYTLGKYITKVKVNE